jgi:hypothetical protein
MINMLYYLILPFLESYWITVAFICNMDRLVINEQDFCQKVQWLAETLFEEGFLKF